MQRSLLKSTVWLTCFASCCLTFDAVAADAPVVGEPPAAEVAAPVFSFEGGLRYWYSTGTSAKDLYNGDGSLLFSRLTYDKLDAHSGEIFFNATHNPTGIFVKGLLGAGGINQGSLVDEDFFYPPDTDPYSNTLSEQDGGDITYFTADLGYNFWNTPRYRVGAFIGYNFWSEGYDAFGCAQQAANPGICVPDIPTSVGVISQDNDWHSLRLGLAGQVQLSERLSLSGDAAFLLTRLEGEDRHHLRPDINPIPEDGDGHGVQLEAVLNYRITDMLNVGVGGRYWRATSEGTSHFEQTPGGGIPQPVDWEAERYGVFLQAGVKLN